MASTTGVLLAASVTINCCSVVFLVTWAGMKQISKLCETRWKGRRFCQHIFEIHRQNQKRIPKIVTEQVATWILIFLGIYILSACGDLILHSAFINQEQCTTQLAISVSCLFAANIGRYLYKIVQDCILLERSRTFWANLIHHVVAVCVYGILILYNEMLLVGIIGLISEANIVCVDVIKLWRCMRYSKNSRSYFVLTVLNCAVCFISRCALPVFFLIAAISVESPLKMSPISLAFFVLSIIFFGIFNLYLMVTAFVWVGSAHQNRKLKQVPRFALPRDINVTIPVPAMSEPCAVDMKTKKMPLNFTRNDISSSPASNQLPPSKSATLKLLANNNIVDKNQCDMKSNFKRNINLVIGSEQKQESATSSTKLNTVNV